MRVDGPPDERHVAATSSKAATNRDATRSAILTTPGFSVAARSIRRTMADRRVPPHLLDPDHQRDSLLMAPPVTASLGAFVTGRLRPSAAPVDRADAGSTTPSAGTDSPGST